MRKYKEMPDPEYRRKDINLKKWQRVITTLALLGAAGSLFFIGDQLRINRKSMENSYNASVVAIRGQLYKTESEYEKEGRDDDEVNNIWLDAPLHLTDTALSRGMLRLLTTDTFFINSKTAEELYKKIWGFETMTNPDRKKKSEGLRKLFLYTEGIFYHIHNAFDYTESNILDVEEWKTWKGSIREMGANPIFISVIWQGYKFNYFSRSYAEFLYSELCSNHPRDLKSKEDTLDYFRDKKFIIEFYPDMKDSTKWVNQMPSYSNK